MRITDVKVRKVDGTSRLKAIVEITIDDAFVVHELRVIEGKNGLFVAMPNRKTANGEYEDICFPITAEARQQITDEILKEYNKDNQEEMFVPNDEQVMSTSELPF